MILTGKQIVSLMRKHKIRIRELSERMGITMIRIREVREKGLTNPFSAVDWVEAITGRKIVCQRLLTHDYATQWVEHNIY